MRQSCFVQQLKMIDNFNFSTWIKTDTNYFQKSNRFIFVVVLKYRDNLSTTF